MSLQHERLVDEHEHATSGLKLALLLGLTIAAVLGVNAWAIKKSPVETRTYEGLTIAKKWELASAGAPAGGIVVVGDSGGNFGVVGSVLTESFGVEAVNLCTFGRFVMTGPRWMIDQAVESAEAPPALVLVIIGSQTLVKPTPDGFVLGQLPVSVETAAKGIAAVTNTELGQVAVSRYAPLYVQSETMGGVFRDEKYPGPEGISKFPIDPEALPIDPDGSSIILWNDPASLAPYTEKKALPEIRAHQGPIPTVRDRSAIERMIQDADSRGYDLVFVDGPIWNGLETKPEQIALVSQFHEYIDAICATSERAWHLPGPIPTFEAAEMQNPFHLMRPAALRYTAGVAARLQALGLPR